MIRTQVYIPDDLHAELMGLARREGVKYSHLIREGVREVIKKEKKVVAKGKRFGEGFIGATDKGSTDLSKNIDYYLYVEPYLPKKNRK